MGQQLNKVIKRKRLKDKAKRKKEAIKIAIAGDKAKQKKVAAKK